MMNVKAFLKSIPTKEKSIANKLISKVRELEEESKGNFVAFVDENNDSWDVQIEIDPKSLNLKKYSCDCPSKKKICTHIIAVLLSMTSTKKVVGQSSVTKKIRKRKQTEAEKLVEQFPEMKVVDWLIKELDANKALMLKFKSSFVETSDSITVDAIKNKYLECKKAVIGRRKKAELSELAKILSLYDPFCQKLMEQIILEIETLESLQLFKELVHTLYFIENDTTKKSPRVKTYRKKLLSTYSAGVSLLPEHNLDVYVENFFTSKVSELDLGIIVPLIELFLPKLNIKKQTDFVKNFFSQDRNFHFVNEEDLILFLDIVVKNEVLVTTHQYFPRLIHFSNYTIAFLNELLNVAFYSQVITLCNEYIDYGVYGLEVVLYDLMAKAHEGMNEKENATTIRLACFFRNPTIYMFNALMLSEISNDQKAIVFHQIDELNLRGFSENYKEVLKLKFALWIIREDYAEIFRQIKNFTTLEIAMGYENELFSNDKHIFLATICNVLDQYWYSKKLKIYYDFLDKAVNEYFSEEELNKFNMEYGFMGDEINIILGV